MSYTIKIDLMKKVISLVYVLTIFNALYGQDENQVDKPNRHAFLQLGFSTGSESISYGSPAYQAGTSQGTYWREGRITGGTLRFGHDFYIRNNSKYCFGVRAIWMRLDVFKASLLSGYNQTGSDGYYETAALSTSIFSPGLFNQYFFTDDLAIDFSATIGPSFTMTSKSSDRVFGVFVSPEIRVLFKKFSFGFDYYRTSRKSSDINLIHQAVSVTAGYSFGK